MAGGESFSAHDPDRAELDRIEPGLFDQLEGIFSRLEGITEEEARDMPLGDRIILVEMGVFDASILGEGISIDPEGVFVQEISDDAMAKILEGAP